MKNSRLTLVLLVLCFALWGVVNNMSDNLVPAFQRIFTMDQDRAVLVQVSFYGAYAVLALFMAILFPTIYGIALGGLDPKCFKLGGPGMIMAILGGAVITPWMADVISAKESVFFSLVPMMDFTWDANLRTSSGAIRASFFIPIICFAVMFAYATIFGESRAQDSA